MGKVITVKPLNFYTYDQNNSGGRHQYDANNGISVRVIIQATSALAANAKATGIGLYFDGNGDCPTCGDRWYEARDSEGEDEPRVYGIVLTDDWNPNAVRFGRKWTDEGQYEAFVHYADGTVKGFGQYASI